MSKKIIGLLLVLCMVVGLLPVVALADATDGKCTIQYGFTKYELQGFDTPIYTVNKEKKDQQDTAGNKFSTWIQTTEGASADNWNTKIEWKSGEAGPTITMKDMKYIYLNQESGKMVAKYDKDNEEWTKDADQTYQITTPADVPTTIVVTGGDSMLAGKFNIIFKNNLTIKSEGNAKLICDGFSSCIDSQNKNGASLTIDANLDAQIRNYYTTYPGGAVLHTKKADINILGGNINVNSLPTSHVKCIAAEEEGNINIKGGNITVKNNISSANGSFGAILAMGGKIVVDGGSIKSETNQSTALTSGVGIEINGGNIDITSKWYGMNTANDADIKINGGTVEIKTPGGSGNGAFYSKSPIIGSKVDAFAGTSEDDADFYDDAKLRSCYFKAEGSGSSSGTKPSETKPAETKPAETKPGTTKPAETKPAGTTGNNNPTTGDNGIAMFSALLLVAAFGVVATVAFSKKNNIVE